MDKQRKRLIKAVLVRSVPAMLLLLAAGWLLGETPAARWGALLLAFGLGLGTAIWTFDRLLHQFGQELPHILQPPNDDAMPVVPKQLPQLTAQLRVLREGWVAKTYVDSIFQSMINTFMIVTPNGRIQQVNPATCELLGYSELELIERPLGTLLNARTFPLQDIGLVDLLSKVPLRNIEATYVASQGHEIPIIFSSSAIHNGQGEVTGIVCVAQDITGLKKTQYALAEREQQFRLLFDEAPIGMMIVDAQSHAFVRVNQAYCELVGYSERQLFAADFTLPLHPAEAESMRFVLSELVTGQLTQFTREVRYEHRQGQVVVVLLQGVLLRNRVNEPYQLLIQAVDISDRKQAEQERIQMTTLLRKAATLSEQVTGILEPRQLLQTAVSFINQQLNLYQANMFLLDKPAGELVLMASAGVVGQTMLDEQHVIPIRHQQSIVAWAARQREMIMVNSVRTSPYFLPHPLLPDTESEVAIPLLAHDRLLGVLDVQDTTVNRFRQVDVDVLNTIARQVAASLQNARLFESIQSSEERLKKMNEALAQTARAKDEFLASMSHELRTPLMGILGKAEVLHEGLFGSLNERQAHAVRRIEESGQQLLYLINDVLDIARIEAGVLEMDVQRVDVTAVCEQCLLAIRPLLQAKKQTLHFHKTPSKLSVLADERRLLQILGNLLSNAVKFTPEGGEIGLEVALEPEQRHIQFVVWDTGIGIAEKQLSGLFQLFRQLDGSLARRHGGTGLGLALVYRLVQLHQGQIDVASRVGQGSRFTVHLPWQGEGETMNGLGLARGRKRPLILLAEDNLAIVESVSIFLPQHGYDLLVARDGETAVAKANSHLPDLILMDVQLPQLDGIEATRRIRQNVQLADIPIVILSGLDIEQNQASRQQAGISCFLRKPFKLQNLIEIINQQLHLQKRDLY